MANGLSNSYFPNESYSIWNGILTALSNTYFFGSREQLITCKAKTCLAAF